MLVVLPLSEYEDMRKLRDLGAHAQEDALRFKELMIELSDRVEAAEHRAIMEAAAAGRVEWLTSDEALALAEAPTPLAFWRKKRGLTQAALARSAGISQNYVAGLEADNRRGNPALLKRLSKALGVRMEDLVDENE
ncbi:MAG: helix-turn-helix domain-containing protein [Hyphomicrobiales bacterium]